MALKQSLKEKQEVFAKSHTFRPTLTARQPPPPLTPDWGNAPVVSAGNMADATPVRAMPAHERLYSARSKATPPSTDELEAALGVTAPEVNETQSWKPSVSNKKTFTDFMTRLDGYATKRQENVKQIIQATTPSHKPQICAKSTKMASVNSALGLSWRKPVVDRDDPRCTFSPKINSRSKSLRPRSATELSTLDSQRAVMRRKQLRAMKEDHEAATYSFTPQLSKTARSSTGRLRVTEDPARYLERVRAERERKERDAERARAAEEAVELAECTFAPVINKAPEFVSGVAQRRIEAGLGKGGKKSGYARTNH